METLPRIHDSLKPQQTATKLLPKKQKPQPGWFTQSESKLLLLITNSAMKMFFNRPSRANAATLRTSRKALKLEMLDAKNDWIKSKNNELNTMSSFGGTKSCWNALVQLRNGLSKTRLSAVRTRRKRMVPCARHHKKMQMCFTHIFTTYMDYHQSMMQLFSKRYLRDRLFKGMIIQAIKKFFLPCQR